MALLKNSIALVPKGFFTPVSDTLFDTPDTASLDKGARGVFGEMGMFIPISFFGFFDDGFKTFALFDGVEPVVVVDRSAGRQRLVFGRRQGDRTCLRRGALDGQFFQRRKELFFGREPWMGKAKVPELAASGVQAELEPAVYDRPAIFMGWQ